MNQSISLYFKSGSSDKEYHVQLNGGTVTFQYGRRGSALQSGTKCSAVSHEQAMQK